MKAMILAAGLGTRLKPFTDKHPKCLAPIGQYTLLEIAIKRLQEYGIQDIIVNVHHFADQIINYLKDNRNFGATIYISHEQGEVLETGGGLKKVIQDQYIQESIIVCNADILTNLNYHELIEQHNKTKAQATLAVQERNSSRQLIFNSKDQLVAWENIKEEMYKPSNFKMQKEDKRRAFSGIQIIEPSIFTHSQLTGKFSLIDLYLETMASQSILAFDHSKDILLDVGKPEAHERAQALLHELWT